MKENLFRSFYKTIRRIFGKPIRIVFLLCTGLVFISYSFGLYFSILIGPFVDALLLAAMILVWLFLGLTLIAINPNKRGGKMLILGLLLVIAGIFNPWDPSLKIYYFINKGRLNDLIHELDSNQGIYEITDFKRYHKRLNHCHTTGEEELVDSSSVSRHLGGCIDEAEVRIESVLTIRNLLDHCSLISYTRDTSYHIFVIDGFVDNEYGILKLREFNTPLKSPIKADPPALNKSFGKYGFTLVGLKKILGDWYYWAST